MQSLHSWSSGRIRFEVLYYQDRNAAGPYSVGDRRDVRRSGHVDLTGTPHVRAEALFVRQGGTARRSIELRRNRK
jgi:hypothetical protein